MPRIWDRIRTFFPPEARFVAGLYLLLAALFALLRLLLMLRNVDLAATVATSTLLQSFWVGLRFDLAVTSYLLIPLFLVILLLRGPRRGRALAVFFALLTGLLLLGVAEAEFYREFESRFNALVFEYLGQPATVGGMIWEGYPVLRYLALWLALAVVAGLGIRFLYRRLLLGNPPPRKASVRTTLLRVMGSTMMLTLMVFASRGGFAHEPLRWGDAFFSESPFANHLALNGTFTLGRSAWDKIYSKQESWVKAMPPDEARALTREMVVQTDEVLLDDALPLLRRPAGPTSTVALRPTEKPVNVVVILMESFSARTVGALGSPQELTPEFDRLAQKGILFERAFSNGTHTHQGVYAALTSFPNLPGYEYLMKMMEANQEFSSLPMLFSRQGHQTLFLYNGEFSWDNKEGFFRQHGMDHFIGTGEYRDPTFVDPVWGVSDRDVFTRANEEFRAMDRSGPFFSAILTLSNHAPFNLPEPLPFARIASDDGLEGRWNGIRYADWALGEFFRQAREEDYFDHTLFVITGDHGFGMPPMITGMQLERFHVPLLFYAPGLIGELGQRRQTVASQVDIGPSILGLLGSSAPHQGWGRNLFSPDLNDPGFAVIKPSGGEERVALVENNYLLMVAPKEKPQLFHSDLGFPPVSSPNLYPQDKARAKDMEKRLHAYVETGILSLRQRSLGVPEGEALAAVKPSAGMPPGAAHP